MLATLFCKTLADLFIVKVLITILEGKQWGPRSPRAHDFLFANISNHKSAS